MMKRAGGIFVMLVICLLVHPTLAHADILRGLGYLLAGVLEIPRATLAGTFNGPPLLGTAIGVLGGTFNSLSYLTSGALELAASAIPIAKTVGPYLIPIFL